MSHRSLPRNSAIPLPQEPTNAITHLQLNGEGKMASIPLFSNYFPTIPIFFSPCFIFFN
jgi:hypothetical protein